MILLFYVYRYNRENRFFARDFKLPWLGNFSAVVLLTLVLTATRISISYLQAYGKIPLYDFQTIYLKSQSTGMFWFLIVVQGIILPILQEFLATGFLFNYAFRRDSVQVAVVGIIVSGLIFSVLNYQSSLINFHYWSNLRHALCLELFIFTNDLYANLSGNLKQCSNCDHGLKRKQDKTKTGMKNSSLFFG